MNPGTKILAAVLALAAAAPFANAQSPGASYGRRGVSHAPLATPRLAYGHAVHRLPAPVRRAWIPGHFERVQRRVWVDDEPERQWLPPLYETRVDGCGRTVRILVREGSWVVVHRPGHFETRWVEVWVAGRWTGLR